MRGLGTGLLWLACLAAFLVIFNHRPELGVPMLVIGVLTFVVTLRPAGASPGPTQRRAIFVGFFASTFVVFVAAAWVASSMQLALLAWFASLLLLPYLYVPVVVYLTTRIQPIGVRALDADEAAAACAPPEVAQALARLEALGFVRRGVVRVEAGRAVAAVAVHEHPSERMVAVVARAVLPGPASPRLSVGLTCVASDRQVLQVTSSSVLSIVPDDPRFEVLRAPGASLDQLLAIQRARLPLAQRAAPLAHVDGDPVAFQAWLEDAGRSQRLACGYFRDVGGVERITWKGAIRIGLGQVAPFRQLRRSRDRAMLARPRQPPRPRRLPAARVADRDQRSSGRPV